MAEIIQFPKKERPLAQVKSVDLYYCWDKKLNNPLLNKLYKENVSYVERWYLQIVHLLNTENLEHPLLQLTLSKNDNILDLLEACTLRDLELHKKFEGSAIWITEPNIKKLNRWLFKWQSLQQHRRLI